MVTLAEGKSKEKSLGIPSASEPTLYHTSLVCDQGHHLAFPINPDHPQPLISCITLVMRPLILDAVGAASSLLQPGEYPNNIGAEFRLEGAESEEVSELPLEEVEVSEQAS